MFSQPVTLAERFRYYRAVRFYPSTPRMMRPAMSAKMAFAHAQSDIEKGRTSYPAPESETLSHGDVLRKRDAAGNRRTFVVAIVHDDDMGAPWEEHDGHGIISKVGSDHVKAPGERLMSSHERHAYVYAYNIAGTIAKARADGWGLAPDDRAKLAAKLGREPTAREVTAQAVEGDFQRCKGWLCDEWQWCGVCIVELPRDAELDAVAVADEWGGSSGRAPRGKLAASLWGIEGDSGDGYLSHTAWELFSEA